MQVNPLQFIEQGNQFRVINTSSVLQVPSKIANFSQISFVSCIYPFHSSETQVRV